MSKQYCVERLIIGNGEKAANEAELKEGKLYASSVLFGGPESFFRIIMKSLRVEPLNHEQHKYLAVSLSHQSMLKTWTYLTINIPTNKTKKQRANMLRQELIKNMKEKPGVSIVIGGPGDRIKSPHSVLYSRPEYGELPFSDNSGRCVDGALVNAIWCIKSDETAPEMKHILQNANNPYIKFSQCVREVHKLKCKVQFQKVGGVLADVFKLDP